MVDIPRWNRKLIGNVIGPLLLLLLHLLLLQGSYDLFTLSEQATTLQLCFTFQLLGEFSGYPFIGFFPGKGEERVLEKNVCEKGYFDRNEREFLI